jgi:hypothetical protein
MLSIEEFNKLGTTSNKNMNNESVQSVDSKTKSQSKKNDDNNSANIKSNERKQKRVFDYSGKIQCKFH